MNAPDSNLLSINTATVRAQWSLSEIVAGCARRGIRGIAPWRDQVAATGLKEAAQRIRDAGLALSGYCRGGMFPATDRNGRRAALDDNKRAVDEALSLSAPCLVLVVGGLPKDSAGRPASKDLASAREMVRAGVGIAVDVYHLWWDPKLRSEIERAGGHPGRLLAFHICDWLVPTTDLLLDRGMMGDGVIDIPLIRSWMEAAGYRGAHEVEIFSAGNWWKKDPDEVLITCIERHRTVC